MTVITRWILMHFSVPDVSYGSLKVPPTAPNGWTCSFSHPRFFASHSLVSLCFSFNFYLRKTCGQLFQLLSYHLSCRFALTPLSHCFPVNWPAAALIRVLASMREYRDRTSRLARAIPLLCNSWAERISIFINLHVIIASSWFRINRLTATWIVKKSSMKIHISRAKEKRRALLYARNF